MNASTSSSERCSAASRARLCFVPLRPMSCRERSSRSSAARKCASSRLKKLIWLALPWGALLVCGFSEALANAFQSFVGLLANGAPRCGDVFACVGEIPACGLRLLDHGSARFEPLGGDGPSSGCCNAFFQVRPALPAQRSFGPFMFQRGIEVVEGTCANFGNPCAVRSGPPLTHAPASSLR